MSAEPFLSFPCRWRSVLPACAVLLFAVGCAAPHRRGEANAAPPARATHSPHHDHTWLAGETVPAAGKAPAGSTAELVVLETTDLHSHVLSYDYDRVEDDPSIGFERTATLIRDARHEFPNTVLLDAGDTTQGTALSEYQALIDPLECGESQVMFRAMDTLGYDAAALGNHDFNYGLVNLARATGMAIHLKGIDVGSCAGGPSFPTLLSNMFALGDDKPVFPPFVILDRTLRAKNAAGKPIETPIRIAVLGFAPPAIMQWDKANLEGRVRMEGMLEAARRHLPEVMKSHPDLVLALVHGGIDTRAYSPTMENAGWHLAALPEIDALLLGHSHAAFPDPGNARSNYAGLPEVDLERGFIRGKPAVMAGFWGRSLGVMHLALRHDGQRWRVDAPASRSELRSVAPTGGTPVAVDVSIAPLVQREHEDTLAWLRTPIGRSDFPMTSHLVALGDSSSLLVVNAAQRAYVTNYVQANFPELAQLPVLTAAAPFKTGFGGPGDFTDVPAGDLSIRNASDLYLYPNYVAALLVDGRALKAWLERSAERFNRIDPASGSPQELLASKFVSYNFDVIQGGVTYRIDVTREVGDRIVDLAVNGKPIATGDRFIVASNNYRATSRYFGQDNSSRLLFIAPDSNREVLIAWIREHPDLRLGDFADARNWRFVPVAVNGPVTVDLPAGLMNRADDTGLDIVTGETPLDTGLSRYRIDLSQD